MNILRRLAWWLVPPYEIEVVTELIRQLVTAEERVRVPPEVLARAVAEARHPDTVCMVRLEQMKPDHVALVIVSAVLERLLVSGHYHIYRNVLNGDGHALLAQWMRCADEAIARGYLTREERQNAEKRLRDGIATMG